MSNVNIFKNILFKWMPYKEQFMCEKKLAKVIKRLKVDDFIFNWDRNSCFIEFEYQEDTYRLEHSVDKAKEKGIILRNGLDCLTELTQSLEDLCQIIDRGTYKFDTWIAGMRQSEANRDEEPDFHEEFHIKYKSSGKHSPARYEDEEYNPLLRDYDRENRYHEHEKILQQSHRE
ncbi:hypothetical protein [Halobacillus sp. Marseille-Q1614]|uniref:hypothetical protein n=1 Tax=Halobacillus sp. Marseille-Q1614 TaxID=2709134 RepID=UPI00156DE145|nr:hypothetical protein [Halobacillus sp. Marseille-Q1614]